MHNKTPKNSILYRRSTAYALCCTALLLFPGCKTQQPPQKPKPVAKKQNLKEMGSKLGKVHGKGWYFPWYRIDPKNPTAPPEPVMIAEAKRGEIKNKNNAASVQMLEVVAEVYQEGKVAATLTAGQVDAEQASRKVLGSQGCVVDSKTKENTTLLKADNIVWDVKSMIFVATGNTYVSRKPKGNGLPITHSGGTIRYSLRDDTIRIN